MMPLPSSIRLFLLLTLCLVPVAACSKRDRQPPPAARPADLSRDPLYESYRFGGEGVIDFGAQPLAMPESSVSALIGRDRILASRLKETGQVLKQFPFSKGKDIAYFLHNGSLEAGVLGDMPALTAAAGGDILVCAMIKRGFSSLVAGRPMLVRDLKGKRIATGLGSTAHFSLLAALADDGLSEADVTLVDMEVDAMPTALAQGKVDAFCAWEPTPTIGFAAHPEFHLIHKGLSLGFLCLRRDFVATHPVESREIIAAVARSCLWMQSQGNLDRAAGWSRSDASRFQVGEYPLTDAQTADLIHHDLINIPIAPQIPEKLLVEHGLLWQEFQFLKKTGKIPPTASWSTVRAAFDLSLIRGVFADPGRFGLERFDYDGGAKPAGGAR